MTCKGCPDKKKTPCRDCKDKKLPKTLKAVLRVVHHNKQKVRKK